MGGHTAPTGERRPLHRRVLTGRRRAGPTPQPLAGAGGGSVMATVTDLAARLAAARQRADALSVALRAARHEQNRIASLRSFATDSEPRGWLRERQQEKRPVGEE